MRLVFALLAALAVMGGPAALAQEDMALPEPSQTHPLYCRGTYNFISSWNGWMQIHLKKADAAAGERGEDLPASSCAWQDRPISADEPRFLVVPETTTGTTALVMCSQNPDCTFLVYAFNDGDGRLRVHSLNVWIWNR